jgi:polysaccharide export outer membrane protein
LLSSALVLLLAVSAFPVDASAQEYKLGTGDVLRITVYGQDDLSKEYQVAPDGTVSFPLIGRVTADGLTAAALAERVRVLLEKDYLVNPQVAVTVREYLSQKVHVMGEAEKPGLYYLTGPTTLVEILSKAGVGKTAGKEIVVVRGGATDPASAVNQSGSNVRRFDIGKMQGGDAKENTSIQHNDLVLIPKATARSFFVFGEVRKPGAYPFD